MFSTAQSPLKPNIDRNDEKEFVAINIEPRLIQIVKKNDLNALLSYLNSSDSNIDELYQGKTAFYYALENGCNLLANVLYFASADNKKTINLAKGLKNYEIAQEVSTFEFERHNLTLCLMINWLLKQADANKKNYLLSRIKFSLSNLKPLAEVRNILAGGIEASAAFELPDLAEELYELNNHILRTDAQHATLAFWLIVKKEKVALHKLVKMAVQDSAHFVLGTKQLQICNKQHDGDFIPAELTKEEKFEFLIRHQARFSQAFTLAFDMAFMEYYNVLVLEFNRNNFVVFNNILQHAGENFVLLLKLAIKNEENELFWMLISSKNLSLLALIRLFKNNGLSKELDKIVLSQPARKQILANMMSEYFQTKTVDPEEINILFSFDAIREDQFISAYLNCYFQKSVENAADINLSTEEILQLSECANLFGLNLQIDDNYLKEVKFYALLSSKDLITEFRQQLSDEVNNISYACNRHYPESKAWENPDIWMSTKYLVSLAGLIVSLYYIGTIEHHQESIRSDMLFPLGPNTRNGTSVYYRNCAGFISGSNFCDPVNNAVGFEDAAAECTLLCHNLTEGGEKLVGAGFGCALAIIGLFIAGRGPRSDIEMTKGRFFALFVFCFELLCETPGNIKEYIFSDNKQERLYGLAIKNCPKLENMANILRDRFGENQFQFTRDTLISVLVKKLKILENNLGLQHPGSNGMFHNPTATHVHSGIEYGSLNKEEEKLDLSFNA